MTYNRRTFLGSAAAGAVVYRPAGPAPALRAAAPNDRAAFGFIGVGIRGTQLLEDFKSVPGVQPVIAADIYDGHLASAREICGGVLDTTRDYHQVLGRRDIDAVVIAAPDHWHYRMALDALAAGKAVYLEKPMTWSIEQGKELVQAVDKSGRLLMVGSGAKTSSLTAKARELIKSGALGKVNMVRMANNRNSPEGAWVYPIPPDASPQTIDWQRFLGPAPKRAFDPRIVFRWRCWWEYSGGVATDLFVHMLCQLHEMMDVPGPSSVVSQGGIYRWDDGRTVPDVMNSVYQYDKGFLADLYVNLGNSRDPQGTVVMGSEGTLQVSRGKLVLTPEPVPSRAQRYGSTGWPAEMRRKYLAAEGGQQVPVKPAQEVQVERGLQHHEYFVQSLREGLPSRETALEGQYAAGAAHLANIAYRKGRRMSWDLKTFKVSEG